MAHYGISLGFDKVFQWCAEERAACGGVRGVKNGEGSMVYEQCRATKSVR